MFEEWNISKIYSIFIKENVYYNILEHIFFKSNYTLITLSDELFISISTLRRRLSKVRYLLKPYDIKIDSNPLRITGDEKNIVDFFTLYFLEAYPTKPYPFPEEQVNFFIKFYKELKRNWHEKASLSEIGYDTTKVLVNFYREKSGIPYTELPDPIHIQTGYNLEILSTDEFLNEFNSVFKTRLSSQLLVRLFSNYLSFPFQFNYDYLLQNRTNPIINTIVTNTESFLNSLSQAYSVPLFNFEEVLLDLVNFILEKNSRKIPSYILNNYSKRFFLQNREISTTFYAQFEKIFNIYLSPVLEVEINPMDIFFHLIIKWERLFYSLILKQPKVKVGIVLNSFINHAELLSEQLRLHYSLYADFQIIYFEDDEKEVEDYQIIITNIADFECSGDKIIIDMSLIDRDWIIISNTIQKYQHKLALKQKSSFTV